jgi:pimeloyl-ACP methyl ester carboxylesterase
MRRPVFLLILLAFYANVASPTRAGAGEGVSPTWLESALARLPWMPSAADAELYEETLSRFGGDAARTEERLQSGAEDVARDLSEYREDTGLSATLAPGEALSADEAAFVRDTFEESFETGYDGRPGYASEREAFIEGSDWPAVRVQDFEIAAGKAELRGVRYANPGGKPIILGHGVIESSRIWREMAHRLCSMGYDVWVPNWRGHGRVSHRSLVNGYEAGDYGFSHMVNEDLPALLRYVHAVSGRKAVLVGHSMGGMIERAASAEYVESRIEIGAPRGFDEVPSLLKVLARVSEPFLSRTSYRLGLAGDTATDSASGMRARLRGGLNQLLRGVVDPALSRALPDGFLNADNVTPAEFSTLREHIISDLNSDIGNDFIHMVNTRRAWLEGLPTPAQAEKTIPTLIVVGELDMMAPAEPILRDVRAQEPGIPVWSARVAKAGHMDLVVGKKAADRLVPLIDRFARDPGALGAPGTHLEIR